MIWTLQIIEDDLKDRYGNKALSLIKTSNRNPDTENLIQYLRKMYNGIQILRSQQKLF